jgi:ketosteroid isomerase-like protein
MSSGVTVSPERQAMVKELFAAIDSGDPRAQFPFMTDDVVLVFGNTPPIQGEEAIQQGVEAFLATIKGLSHEIVGVYEVDGSVTIRLLVTYTRLDDKVVRVPVVTFFEETDGKISYYQVYYDLAPVYAEAS